MFVMGRCRIIIWRFFTFTLAWSVFQSSGGTLVYTYNEDPVDWKSAQTKCQSSGGNLFNGSTEYQLMNCTSFPKNETFWIGMYSTFSPWIQIIGKSPITTSSCFNGALVDGVLEKASNISCQSNLPFVCQLETDNVRAIDCVVIPSNETTELSSSDIQTTTSAVTSKEEDIWLIVGVLVLLGMILIVLVGTVTCHRLYGQRPLGQEVVGYINDGTVSDMSDTIPRNSLFEDDTYDVIEVDEPIVSYGQHIDGRFSTFVHTPEGTGEHTCNMQYINENDDIFPL